VATPPPKKKVEEVRLGKRYKRLPFKIYKAILYFLCLKELVNKRKATKGMNVRASVNNAASGGK